MDGSGAAVALSCLAAFASAMLTWAWIAFARRRAIEDLPGQRRLHGTATPRGGGIGIALVLPAALAWIAAGAAGATWAPGLAVGIAAFATVGLLDDLLELPAPAKLGLQLLAAAALLAGAAGGLPAPWPAAIALLLACAYFVNVWNFMDGSNGLVGIQALLIALALAAWPGQEPALRLAALALAGACLGFLPFNFPRARVFLGDVGSHAMGAAVFGLLWLSWRAGSISAVQALLMVAVPLLDTGLTLLRRLAAGRVVWHAHREHLYQYAVRRGNSHARVAIAYGMATAAAIGLAWLAGGGRPDFLAPGLLAGVSGLGALAYVFLRRHWLDRRSRRELSND